MSQNIWKKILLHPRHILYVCVQNHSSLYLFSNFSIIVRRIYANKEFIHLFILFGVDLSKIDERAQKSGQKKCVMDENFVVQNLQRRPKGCGSQIWLLQIFNRCFVVGYPCCHWKFPKSVQEILYSTLIHTHIMIYGTLWILTPN